LWDKEFFTFLLVGPRFCEPGFPSRSATYGLAFSFFFVGLFLFSISDLVCYAANSWQLGQFVFVPFPFAFGRVSFSPPDGGVFAPRYAHRLGFDSSVRNPFLRRRVLRGRPGCSPAGRVSFIGTSLLRKDYTKPACLSCCDFSHPGREGVWPVGGKADFFS